MNSADIAKLAGSILMDYESRLDEQVTTGEKLRAMNQTLESLLGKRGSQIKKPPRKVAG